MQTYIVQDGDTLYGISKQFGVSIENLRRENNLSSNTIVPGQVLKIPSSTTTILYTVKRGDNLYSIARNYNITVDELIRVNNLKSNTLTIGQQLIIPIGNTGVDNSQTGYITYTVKKGDNLYTLANAYNTTVDAIMQFNNLTSTALSIGQQLKIPTKTSNGNINTNYITYTVKKGDNLYTLANTYNTTVDAIMQFNNLTSTALSIGQQLKIPTTTTSPPSVPSYKNYTVQKGDSLYKIATMFNMTVEELMTLNNLSSTILSIGQILKVKNTEANPPIGEEVDECYGEGYKEPTYQTYTVKKGDSLYTIAQRFNTTVDQLIALNDLTNNTLSIGQVLKIKEVIQ